MTFVARVSRFGIFALSAASCGGDETLSESSEIQFHGEQDLFPVFNGDTGLQPPNQPVQVELMIRASGGITVEAAAVTGVSTVFGKPGSGSIALIGAFSLEGELKVNLPLLPPYDGPIPGFDTIKVPVSAKTAFDPFLIHGKATVQAAIPETELPPIPLPGLIPGKIIITVSDGSIVTSDFSGACASVHDGQAHYEGQTSTSGTLTLKPKVEIDNPVNGTQTFDIPELTIPIPAATLPIDLGTKSFSPGSSDPPGDPASAGSCSPTGAG